MSWGSLPFMWNGMITAVRHDWEHHCVAQLVLRSWRRTGSAAGGSCFSSSRAISSGPAAFFGLGWWSARRSSSRVNGRSSVCRWELCSLRVSSKPSYGFPAWHQFCVHSLMRVPPRRLLLWPCPRRINGYYILALFDSCESGLDSNFTTSQACLEFLVSVILWRWQCEAVRFASAVFSASF